MPILADDAEDGDRESPSRGHSRSERGSAGLRRQIKAPDVHRELLDERSTALLQELHLLTRDGNLNADARRKLKQVNHLAQLLKPSLEGIRERFAAPVLVDAGSGNAYLGFILYQLFLQPWGKGELLSIEARPELTARSQERAARLGFSRMRFQTSELVETRFPDRFHLLTALHACDTATDDALVAAITHGADHVAVVPCCQAELAEQLRQNRGSVLPAIHSLFEHPWHRREFGSHLTNVIRVLALESAGYQVTVTELTGWEHSLKNELILGRKVHRENLVARSKLEELVAATGVRPKLLGALAFRVN